MNPTRTLVICFILLPVALITGCESSSRDEVASVKSPDGYSEATLYETNGGSTSSFGYEVELRGKGGVKRVEIATLYGAVRNENAYGVNVKWNGNEELDIEYLKAKWHSKFPSTVALDGRNIHVMVKDGISDPSAPSGGMLHNLNRK